MSCGFTGFVSHINYIVRLSMGTGLVDEKMAGISPPLPCAGCLTLRLIATATAWLATAMAP